MFKHKSLTAQTSFLARADDGTTVTVRAGEALRLHSVRDSDSGQIVRFDLPTVGLVTAIGAPAPARTPWRLHRA